MAKISAYVNGNPPQATDEFIIARAGTNKKLTWANLLAAFVPTDGDKGDITVSGSGTVWTIDAGVVTLAKMADMATASLLGRNTAGTGSPEVLSAATVRTLLSLVPGTDVQAYDAQLTDIAGLTPTDNGVIIGNGSNFVVESGATLKTSLGLTIGTDIQAYDAQLADIAGIAFAQGDILYFNGSNIVKLAAGTSGWFLKTQGAGANPVWAAIAGGGDMLAANNLSDVANQQTALNNVTAVAAATNEYVLTKDTGTGNAIWKVASATVGDGDKGDITVSGGVWTIDNNAVTLAKLATQAANTVLANATAGAAVPTAFALSEQTILGRATGGNISAIAIDSDLTAVSANDDTVPSAKATKAALDLKLALAGGTITGAINLGENAGLEIDSALSADGKYSGIVRAGTAGATLAFGDLCYLAAADSRWELVDANAAATSQGLLGICVLAAAADGNATTMLLWGLVRADTAFPALTIGAPVFASTTAGDVQTTAPSGAADIIRIVGQGYTADELFFCPSPDFFEHA